MTKQQQHIIPDDVDLTRANWELFQRFDDDNNPVYKKGELTDAEELQQLKDLVNELMESEIYYAAVKMGMIQLHPAKGEIIELRLVFDQQEKSYASLLSINDKQYLATDEFIELIEQYRTNH